MIINLGDAPFKAFIRVTYPGGTCTVSLGDKSFTHSGGGTHTFTVNKKGTWTVKAANSHTSKSTTVEITSKGQEKSVTLSYTVNIYNSGTINTSVTGGLSAYAYVPSTSGSGGVKPTVTKNTSSIKLAVDGEAQGGSFFTENAIDLTSYKTLKITVSSASTKPVAGSTATGYVRFGTTASRKSGYTVGPAKTIASGSAGNVSSSTTFSIDVSSLTGKHYLFINLYGSGSKSITFTRWYLES